MKMIWDTLLLLLATSAFFCFPSLALMMMTTKGEIHWLNNLFISTSLALQPTLAGSPFSSYHKIKKKRINNQAGLSVHPPLPFQPTRPYIIVIIERKKKTERHIYINELPTRFMTYIWYKIAYYSALCHSIYCSCHHILPPNRDGISKYRRGFCRSLLDSSLT